jgi:hypothetical protein
MAHAKGDPMGIIEPAVAARRLRERLAKTESARQQAMLETVIDHLEAEAVMSLDRLMATLAPEPEYHLWANGADFGPKTRAAVAAYYEQLIVDKRAVLEFDIDRVVVDDDCVVTEGWIRAINKGAIAKARGWIVDDDDADYLVTQRVVIFWPFNEAGQMVGEDGYANFDPRAARRLDESQLPEIYKALVAHV